MAYISASAIIVDKSKMYNQKNAFQEESSVQKRLENGNDRLNASRRGATRMQRKGSMYI